MKPAVALKVLTVALTPGSWVEPGRHPVLAVCRVVLHRACSARCARHLCRSGGPCILFLHCPELLASFAVGGSVLLIIGNVLCCLR
jgi:hypothetical protein